VGRWDLVTDPAQQLAAKPSFPRTARARARAQITQEIMAAGRRHLATDGPAGLSLRAIARELGMASSAVYRYVASRDELLTRLIIDSYNELGVMAEQAEQQVAREDFYGRFAAACHAVRDWSLAHPNDYALLYGSPVPGYEAPEETVAAANRVPALLASITLEAMAAGRLEPPADSALPGPASAALEPIRGYFADATPEPLMLGMLMVWASLFGVLSFEVFGRFHQIIDDAPALRNAFFDECVRRWARGVGIVAGAAPAT
jgi:AcrR family transcriptional regulator